MHEYGHFFAARRFRITVHEFGFGFPPRLFGRLWRSTLYSLNLLPLGGFVRIKGEEGEDAHDHDSFSSRPVWQRATIILAGVVMNVVLGWALFTGGFIIGTPTVLDNTIPEYRIKNAMVVIHSLLPNTPATTVDFFPGDVITKVDDTPIARLRDLQAALADKGNTSVTITINRKGELLPRTLRPIFMPEINAVGIGIGIDEIGTVRYPFFAAIVAGTHTTVVMLRDIVVAFWDLLSNLVVRQKISLDLSGPIGIAVLTGRVASRGIAYLVQFIAALSLNLAVLNVLPIPALDGGRFLFLCIEKLRGKPLQKSTEAHIHRFGFFLLLLLVVLVTYRDILRLLPH